MIISEIVCQVSFGQRRDTNVTNFLRIQTLELLGRICIISAVWKRWHQILWEKVVGIRWITQTDLFLFTTWPISIKRQSLPHTLYNHEGRCPLTCRLKCKNLPWESLTTTIANLYLNTNQKWFKHYGTYRCFRK